MQEKFEDWADNELIAEAKSRYWSINVLGSYSTRDMLVYDKVASMLEDRGYKEVPSVEFIKDEEVEEDNEGFSVPLPGGEDYIGEELG